MSGRIVISRSHRDALYRGGLGWGFPKPEDSGAGHVELILPAEELRRPIAGKRSSLAQAIQMGQGEREGQESGWEQREKAHEACGSILDQLGDGERGHGC